MGEQRQLFRFRLPWLSAAATPRPAAQTQAPSQPTTTIPIQRPPFRPAGIAPVQTTPIQAQLQKTEPQPAAPSRAATDLKSTSQPASPPRLTNQIRAASVPPSPSRRATETQVTFQPVSPSRRIIQTQTTSQTQSPSRAPTKARTASVAPSPSRIASQPQSTVQTVSKKSPSRLASQPGGQTSPQPSSPSRRANHVQILSPPKKSSTATSTKPPSTATQETTFKPFGLAVKPSEASAQGKEVASITVAATETPSAPVKPKGREQRKKVAEERKKAATKGSTTKENPAPRTYVNSNIESINNSIVFESSVNGRNPGVHLEFLHDLAESTKYSAKAEPIETHKAEFNITPYI